MVAVLQRFFARLAVIGGRGSSLKCLQLSVHLGEHFLELRLGLEWSPGAGKPSRDNFPLPSQLDQPLQLRLESLRLLSGHLGTCGWVPYSSLITSGHIVGSAPLRPFSKHSFVAARSGIRKTTPKQHRSSSVFAASSFANIFRAALQLCS